jgi:hypothetical protein
MKANHINGLEGEEVLNILHVHPLLPLVRVLEECGVL